MPAIASNHIASHFVVMSCHGRSSRWARSMILSSMSVTFETSRTSRPGPLEVAAQDVVHERGPPVTEMRRAVHRRPAQVDADLARLAQSQLTHGSRGGVIEVQHRCRSLRGPPPATRAPFPTPTSTFALHSRWAGSPESSRKPGAAAHPTFALHSRWAGSPESSRKRAGDGAGRVGSLGWLWRTSPTSRRSTASRNAGLPSGTPMARTASTRRYLARTSSPSTPRRPP